MEFQNSFTDAFQACLDNQCFSIAHLHKMSKNMRIDYQGCYKIFFSLSGQKNFHIDENTYACLSGDVFLISPHEWHYFSDYSDTQDHERIVCFIYPSFLRECCSEHTDLSYCFSQASALQSHRLSLSAIEQEQLLSYIHRLNLQNDFGQDILDKSLFLEMLVFLNRTFISHSAFSKEEAVPPKCIPPQINAVLTYINHHLCDNLSTGALSERFFLSPSYLCKLFRNTTGTTLHKYIIAKRITHAKKLLSDGMSVSATCTACGFNDYSNFIKIFTRSVGISPKKYASLQKESSPQAVLKQ